MNCRQTERWILKSLESEIDSSRRRDGDEHLAACPACRSLRAEYEALRGRLKAFPEGEPGPFFARRVMARIEVLERPAPADAPAWQKWCLRAIPVSLFLIGLFVGGLIFLPSADDGWSRSEALLLDGSNPLAETTPYFDETKIDDKNVMIIFAADERIANRRPQP
jgi:predicted anti-sigma-YlaC factor YlaD